MPVWLFPVSPMVTLGSAPDLGAYEFGSLAWNAGVGSRPTLAIASPGNGNLVLTASPDAAYYQLYAATNLAPPLWIPVTNTPLAVGQSMVRDVACCN